MRYLYWGLLSCSVAICILPSQDAPHDLRTAAKKGDTFWFVESADQSYEVVLVANPSKTWVRVHRTFRVTIQDVLKNGHRIVEIVIVRVHGSMQLMGSNEQHFDSADPPAAIEQAKKTNSTGDFVSRMVEIVNRKFLARIDANGKVASSLIGVAAEMKHHVPKLRWDDRALQQLAETAFGRLPEKLVSVGDNWDHEQQAPGGNTPFRQKAVVTLKSWGDDAFALSVTGTVDKMELPITASDKEIAKEAAKMRTKTKISNGKVTGEQSISRRDGVVIASKITVTADLSTSSPRGVTQAKLRIVATLKRSTKEAALPKTAPK